MYEYTHTACLAECADVFCFRQPHNAPHDIVIVYADFSANCEDYQPVRKEDDVQK